MVIIASWEKRFPREHLSKNAAHRPHINGLMKLAVNQGLGEGGVVHTFVYCLKVNIISGALYHLVATYSVMKPVSVPEGSAVLTERAKPKSQTLRSQLALSRRLEGFRSR